MKKIKSILKNFDAFGVSFSFRYKGHDKYQTSLSGLFVIGFIGVSLWIGIYYFIPFITRKNFTTVYYTINLPYAEKINLKTTQAAFAVGLDCYRASDGTNAEDLLKLELTYTIQKKSKNGTKIREETHLSTHPCTYEDFYNYFNDSLEYLNMNIFQCLDDNSQIVQGIYTDEVFSYYKFTVSIKEDNEEYFRKVNKYLLENDCKLNIYYTDITIDLDNYTYPSSRHLDSVFIQLEPNYIKKMNAYYLNQYLTDDNYFIWVFDEGENYKVETKFSRSEEYSLYKGMDRYNSGLYDYQIYAMLYIRADTKKIEIKRKYQKLMEFFADSSSLLMALYEVLIIIFTFINNFYAEHSITKKIFFFKEFEYKHLNLSKKLNKIKELIQVTDNPNCNKSIHFIENSSILKEKKEEKEEKKEKEKGIYIPYLEQESGQINFFNNEEIDIYTKRRKFPVNRKNYDLSKENDIKKTKIMKKKIKKILKKPKCKNNNSSYISNIEKNFSNNKIDLYEKSIEKPKILESQLENVNIEKMRYSFNVFEIIDVSFFKCCLTKKLSLKNILNNKANAFLYHKLDITLYVRNMILLDIMNKTLIEDNMKSIINFISRPILSVNKNKDDEFESFYRTYTDAEFDKFSNEIYEFAQKSNKVSLEKKLFDISNKQLKEFI